ncbi:phosphotransferase [Nocardioides sp. NPDC023903]|uniref:phosphotransferase n=1 Tax=Nocardioides sp. NPDC023903 TaxID=3157195 RepID=UPI0033C340AF
MTEAEALTTPISMLWESADPGAALTDRFGFASATEATDWLTGVLAEHWGLKVAACERLVISDANCLAWIVVDGCRMIAKWSMRPRVFARLEAIARLTVWLGERGIPVSMPQAARDGRVQVEVAGFSLGLQRVVDGELLDITDPVQVEAAGEMLARMHAAMAEYPEGIPTDEPPAPGAQLVGTAAGWTTSLRPPSCSGRATTTGARHRPMCAGRSSRPTSRFIRWRRTTSARSRTASRRT